MSSAGIHARVMLGGRQLFDCLVVGEGVPRIHHGDGIPVYLVVSHKLGIPQRLKDGRTTLNLLAYPVAWPGPGGRGEERWIFAQHELLTWEGPVPVFDVPQ